MFEIFDTENDELKEYYNSLYEKRVDEKEKYQLGDIALVHVTNHLPQDHIIRPLCHVPFVVKERGLVMMAVVEYCKEHGIENKEKIDHCIPYSTQYRSTVHFSQNGRVSSHLQGNFEGRSFVVVDPLSAHFGKEKILSLRPEDTFIEGDVVLSSDVCILVNADDSKGIKEVEEGGYRFYLYRGNQEEAVYYLLLELGYIPELIGKDYVIDSQTSQMLLTCLDRISQGNSNFFEKHCYTESYREDDQKSLKLWNLYDKLFYQYFLKSLNYTEEECENISNRWLEGGMFSTECVNSLKKIIDQIGIDEFENIVQSFNNDILNQISSGIYLTNDEILEGRIPTITGINNQKENKII